MQKYNIKYLTWFRLSREYMTFEWVNIRILRNLLRKILLLKVYLTLYFEETDIDFNIFLDYFFTASVYEIYKIKIQWSSI